MEYTKPLNACFNELLYPHRIGLLKDGVFLSLFK